MNKNPESDRSDVKKETWATPRVTELDIRSTENAPGGGPDGGTFGNELGS